MQSSPPFRAQALKELNTTAVRRALQTARIATVRELAAATNLSSVTAGAIIQKLVRSGVAREGEQQPSLGGRPSRQYHFVADHALVAVVLTREIEGRDTVCLRVADLDGRVVAADDRPFYAGSLQEFEPLLDAAFARYPRIAALGFAVPGIELEGTLIVLDYPALVGAPIVEHFRSRYRVPVVVENDVNAAVLGRGLRSGAPAGEAYLYFPQKFGPGAGLRVGGRLIKGRRNFAGEVSWLPLGVSWGDRSWTSSFETSCDIISRVVTSLTAVLAPDSVVLFGEFLTPQHVEAIETQCRESVPRGMTPALTLAHDFTQDVQEGLVGLTLELLPV